MTPFSFLHNRYHWVKYAKQKVSIIINRQVQNWSPDPDNIHGDTPIKTTTLDRPFRDYNTCLGFWACSGGPPPYRHFYHFTGNSKPWMRVPAPTPDQVATKEQGEMSQFHYWYHHLYELNRQHQFLTTSWEQVQATLKKPPLGKHPRIPDLVDRVNRRHAGTTI
jgi:hypothetical protein